jgi:hypothetical protein
MNKAMKNFQEVNLPKEKRKDIFVFGKKFIGAKRALKQKTYTVYECRCDERLKSKDERSTRLTYTG